jgi:hypothetical protein
MTERDAGTTAHRTRVPLPLDAGQVLGLHVELVVPAAHQRADTLQRPGRLRR